LGYLEDRWIIFSYNGQYWEDLNIPISHMEPHIIFKDSSSFIITYDQHNPQTKQSWVWEGSWKVFSHLADRTIGALSGHLFFSDGQNIFFPEPTDLPIKIGESNFWFFPGSPGLLYIQESEKIVPYGLNQQ